MIYKLPIYRVALVREGALRSASQTVSTPADAVRIFRMLHGDIDRECLAEIMLDTRCNIRGVNTVSVGDLSSAIVHPREVYKPAILKNAARIILLHPHPSGDPQPSAEDRMIAKRIKAAGDILGIDLADFIVTGDTEFVSFVEDGYL